MTSPLTGNPSALPPPDSEGPADPAGLPYSRAASAALTVSIVSLLTAPLWIIAGLLFNRGALLLAALPGLLSLVLAFRALNLAATAEVPSGNKRGIVSLTLGLLSLVISLLSSGFCARGITPAPKSDVQLEGRLSPARIAALAVSVKREVEARSLHLCGSAPLTMSPT